MLKKKKKKDMIITEPLFPMYILRWQNFTFNRLLLAESEWDFQFLRTKEKDEKEAVRRMKIENHFQCQQGKLMTSLTWIAHSWDSEKRAIGRKKCSWQVDYMHESIKLQRTFN